MTGRASLGDGRVSLEALGSAGRGCVIEPGARIFGPAHVHLGEDVYIGHGALLRAYPGGELRIGDGCWIGPGCFINSYGGVRLGRRVGLGPGACVLSSEHAGGERDRAVLDTPLEAREVVIEDGADLGARSVILPGVRIGARARVGAGAVVTRSVPAGAVVAGVPARPLHSEEPR